MNEGTPLGSEYNRPLAVVLKGPTAELYLYLLVDTIIEDPVIGSFRKCEPHYIVFYEINFFPVSYSLEKRLAICKAAITHESANTQK
jgi:hypothetical protein